MQRSTQDSTFRLIWKREECEKMQRVILRRIEVGLEERGLREDAERYIEECIEVFKLIRMKNEMKV